MNISTLFDGMSPNPVDSTARICSCIHECVDFCKILKKKNNFTVVSTFAWKINACNCTTNSKKKLFKRKLRLKVAKPSGCYNHIARDVNGNDIEHQPIVAHDAAKRSTSNFHNDASYSVHIINPSRKRFR